MDKLHYVALPGQIAMGPKEDPLVNTEPAYITIEGFAIPSHLDDCGHPIGSGFDIASIKLDRQTEFRSVHAIVWAPKDFEFHWRQVPQAVQWADEQVGRAR
jgi:hypothetical protein